MLLAFPLYITWLQIPPPLTRSPVQQLHFLSLALKLVAAILFFIRLWQLWKESIMLGSPNPQQPRVEIKERPPTHVSPEDSLRISNQATESFLSLGFFVRL